jgi:hypothetical protein
MTERHEALGKIFIAGTGRSGTTTLHHILGTHPEIFKIPYESKFIVEADGLNALLPRLHEDFSVTASDLALIRFIEMTDGDLDGQTQTKSGDSLKYYERIGKEFYFPPLNEFINNMTEFVTAGFPYPKRFDRREELIALARRLVSTMFGEPTLAAGKRHWVEKTPSNLIAMDFLWDLFPEATIIHIKRDPRGVLFSFSQQSWLPRDLTQVTSILGHIYWRWMRLKPRLDLANRRYIEIKLEDLAYKPRETMATVASVLGISSEFVLDGLDPLLVDRWKTEMPAEQRRYAEQELGSYFALMGYERNCVPRQAPCLLE